MSLEAKAELTKTGRLRFGINLSNMLLVSDRKDDGTPVGVSPDMARAVAEKLDVPFEYICYGGAGQTADAISNGDVDIGLIAFEPKRAETIGFAAPYCGIEATYLVPHESPFQSVNELDRPGIRIAISHRAAYDLYLSRTLKHAELCYAEGLQAAFELYKQGGYDALAGIKPALLSNAAELGNARILEDSYTIIRQSLGTQPGNGAAISFLNNFVAEAQASGFVEQRIAAHGMDGKLTPKV